MDWKTVIAAMITAAGILVAAGRWIGGIEARLEQLERATGYYHGALPSEVKR